MASGSRYTLEGDDRIDGVIGQKEGGKDMTDGEKGRVSHDKEARKDFIDRHIRITKYKGESQMQSIMDLIDGELSEPYTVYTYRYFLNQWPQLCLLAHYVPSSDTTPSSDGLEIESEELSSSSTQINPTSSTNQDNPIGVVISKLDKHLKGKMLMRGYIGMISIKKNFRGKGIASELLKTILQELISKGAQEIVLETEIDNSASLKLYEKFGFLREKRLFNFYLNGKDCFRLICEIPKTFWHQNPPLTPPVQFQRIPLHTNQDHSRTKEGQTPQYSSSSASPLHRPTNDANYSFSQMHITPQTTTNSTPSRKIFSQYDIM